MTDPRTIVAQARQGPVPEDWRVFTKKRERVSGVRLLHGISHDPDPLLAITPDGAIEYKNEREPLVVLNFCDISGMKLRVAGSSFSDSSTVRLSVWVDLTYRGGSKGKVASDLLRRKLRHRAGGNRGLRHIQTSSRPSLGLIIAQCSPPHRTDERGTAR